MLRRTKVKETILHYLECIDSHLSLVLWCTKIYRWPSSSTLYAFEEEEMEYLPGCQTSKGLENLTFDSKLLLQVD